MSSLCQRYYGKSLPFGQDSLVPPNISYLSVGQALADFAVLIQDLKSQYTGIFKVISFGGRYHDNKQRGCLPFFFN